MTESLPNNKPAKSLFLAEATVLVQYIQEYRKKYPLRFQSTKNTKRWSDSFFDLPQEIIEEHDKIKIFIKKIQTGDFNDQNIKFDRNNNSKDFKISVKKEFYTLLQELGPEKMLFYLKSINNIIDSLSKEQTTLPLAKLFIEENEQLIQAIQEWYESPLIKKQKIINNPKKPNGFQQRWSDCFDYISQEPWSDDGTIGSRVDERRIILNIFNRSNMMRLLKPGPHETRKNETDFIEGAFHTFRELVKLKFFKGDELKNILLATEVQIKNLLGDKYKIINELR